MTIYGSQIKFNVPASAPYAEFLDAFDAAIAPLNSENGFYSVDAHVNMEDGAILVGVNVPEGADEDEFFTEKIANFVLPALLSTGIDVKSIAHAPSTEFVYA